MEIENYIEYIAIAIQVVLFLIILGVMMKYRKAFKGVDKVDFEIDEETGEVHHQLTIFPLKGHKKLQELLSDINSYIASNNGGIINFSVLTDLVDRHEDTLEDPIGKLIPIPLYVGLGATMLAVVFGLGKVELAQGVELAQNVGSDTAKSIGSLTGLIKVVGGAMKASFSGLFFTALSTLIHIRYTAVVVKEKNRFVTFIQTRLFPIFNRKEETENGQLIAQIQNFSVQSASLVKTMNQTSRDMSESIEQQYQTLMLLNEIDVSRIATYNSKTFNELMKSMESIEELTNQLNKLTQYIDNIDRLVSRTSQVEHVLNNISKTQGENQELLNFLSHHLSDMDMFASAAKEMSESNRRYVAEGAAMVRQDIDDAFDSMSTTKNNVKNAIGEAEADFREKTDLVHEELSKINKQFGTAVIEQVKLYKDSMEEMVNQAIEKDEFDKLSKAVKESTEQLSNLTKHVNGVADRLEEIELTIPSNLSVESNPDVDKLVKTVESSVIKIQSSLNKVASNSSIYLPAATNEKRGWFSRFRRKKDKISS